MAVLVPRLGLCTAVWPINLLYYYKVAGASCLSWLSVERLRRAKWVRWW